MTVCQSDSLSLYRFVVNLGSPTLPLLFLKNLKTPRSPGHAQAKMVAVLCGGPRVSVKLKMTVSVSMFCKFKI